MCKWGYLSCQQALLFLNFCPDRSRKNLCAIGLKRRTFSNRLLDSGLFFYMSICRVKLLFELFNLRLFICAKCWKNYDFNLSPDSVLSFLKIFIIYYSNIANIYVPSFIFKGFHGCKSRHPCISNINILYLYRIQKMHELPILCWCRQVYQIYLIETISLLCWFFAVKG